MPTATRPAQQIAIFGTHYVEFGAHHSFPELPCGVRAVSDLGGGVQTTSVLEGDFVAHGDMFDA
jgi:hypothetical protein